MRSLATSNRVAVTGAGGFIGRTVVEALARSGWRVRGLVRRPEPALAAFGAEIVPGSLEDPESLRRLVDGVDAIVHAAGVIKARRREDFFAVNTNGTVRLLEAAARSSPAPRVLLVSSLAAREPALSPYAESKRRAEEALARSGLEHRAVRPPAVYGPGDRATLPLFRQLARGFVLVPAGAEARFSLLYVEDLAATIARLLEQPRWDGGVIELDDGRANGYSWADLATIAGRCLERRVRCLAVPHRVAWLPAAANQALWTTLGRAPMLTVAKLHEIYHPDWVCRSSSSSLEGGESRTPFEEGFPKTLRWYKQRGWL